MERRLAAILAADVVGYSRLMEQHEADTFERMRAHRQDLLEPEIEKHHGRIFKLMGDGLLAEFGSVVDAVECAVSLQRGMAERNSDVSDDRRIDVRIGINLGDVIVEGEDRHGDGVNIAARLQQIAQPGGICVSGKVAKEVEKKLALRFEPIGEHQVKNIAEPVHVYRVSIETGAAGTKRRGWRSYRRFATATLLVVMSLGIAWYLQSLSEISTSDQGIPIVVVLPFEDLTGGETQSNLGRGIAEAFITDLSTFPDFEVVSSTSSFAYAGKSVPEIVNATGALFVIEGSIRRTGEKALITVQLIRGSTDRHLWSARIEENFTEPVAFQSAAANRLRDALGGFTGVLREEYEKLAWAKADTDLTEYDYHVRGGAYALREEFWRAIEEDKKGLESFPNSVLLRCKLALHSYPADAIQMVDEVAALPRTTRLEEWICRFASAWVRGGARAVADAKAVVAMAPYDTFSRAVLSSVMRTAGLHDEAIEWATFAVTHDPQPTRRYFDALLDAYRSAGMWREAIELAEAEIRANPSPSRWWYEFLGNAYVATGQHEKAKEAFKKSFSLPEPAQ